MDESERGKRLKDMYGRKLLDEYMQVLSDESVWMRSAKCYKHSKPKVKAKAKGRSSDRSPRAASATATATGQVMSVMHGFMNICYHFVIINDHQCLINYFETIEPTDRPRIYCLCSLSEMLYIFSNYVLSDLFIKMLLA